MASATGVGAYYYYSTGFSTTGAGFSTTGAGFSIGFSAYY